MLDLRQEAHGCRAAEDLAGGVPVSVMQGIVGHLAEEVPLGWVNGGGELGRSEA